MMQSHLNHSKPNFLSIRMKRIFNIWMWLWAPEKRQNRTLLSISYANGVLILNIVHSKLYHGKKLIELAHIWKLCTINMQSTKLQNPIVHSPKYTNTQWYVPIKINLLALTVQAGTQCSGLIIIWYSTFPLMFYFISSFEILLYLSSNTMSGSPFKYVKIRSE